MHQKHPDDRANGPAHSKGEKPAELASVRTHPALVDKREAPAGLRDRAGDFVSVSVTEDIVVHGPQSLETYNFKRHLKHPLSLTKPIVLWLRRCFSQSDFARLTTYRCLPIDSILPSIREYELLDRADCIDNSHLLSAEGVSTLMANTPSQSCRRNSREMVVTRAGTSPK